MGLPLVSSEASPFWAAQLIFFRDGSALRIRYAWYAMNVLLIDPMPDLEQALRATGHDVRTLRLGPGVFHLPGILRHMDFSPDIVFQQECLGLRSFFGGLESLNCPTLFWAIDTHLNMFWQQWYALLFDAVLTPHISLFKALPSERHPRVLERFSQMGQRRQWVPHERRGHGLSLCARLDRHRPVRNWLVELLKPQGLHVVDGLSMEEMMRLYDDSRLVPNESIANEVNFRLMEGASSGCLVLSPDVGEDQNELLRPDKEFLIYHDGLELLEQIAWAKKRPDAVEAMGRAAMLRIQAEHLPEHRAATVLRLASSIAQNRLTGHAASLAFWISMALQIRNHRMDLDPHDHARQGLRQVSSLPAWRDLPLPLRPFVSQTLAQSLCLLAEKPDESGASQPAAEQYLLSGGGVAWPVDSALSLCRNLLAEAERAGQENADEIVGTHSRERLMATEADRGQPSSVPEDKRVVEVAGSGQNDGPPAMPGEGAACSSGALASYACPHPACTLELASVASAFALRQGNFSLALAFWLRYAGTDGKALPRDIVSLCLRWASIWERRGWLYTSGSSFVPEKGFLPESAVQYLTFAQALAPESDRIVSRQCAVLLTGRRDLLSLHIGYLADICLTEPANWRAQLDYGLVCLQACRVEAGLFEVADAWAKAAREGKARLFKGRLAASSSGERVWEAVRTRLR